MITSAPARRSGASGVSNAVCPIRSALTTIDAGSCRSIGMDSRSRGGPSGCPNSAVTRARNGPTTTAATTRISTEPPTVRASPPTGQDRRPPPVAAGPVGADRSVRASLSWANPQSTSSGPTAIRPLVLVTAVSPVAAPSPSSVAPAGPSAQPVQRQGRRAGHPRRADQVGLRAGRLEHHHRRGRQHERGEQLGPPATAELGGDPCGHQEADHSGRPLHQVVQVVPAGEQAQVQQQVLGSGRDGHLPVDGGGPEVQVALGHPVLHLRQVVGLRVEVVRLGQQRDQQLHQDQPADSAGEEPLARSGRTPGVDRRGEQAGRAPEPARVGAGSGAPRSAVWADDVGAATGQPPRRPAPACAAPTGAPA